jgi:methyl-accepting chemotaxis protein
MNGNRTFGRKLAMGLAAVVALGVLIGVVSIFALRYVVVSKDHVINVETKQLIEAESLRTSREEAGGEIRAFLLTKNEIYLDGLAQARANFAKKLNTMNTREQNPKGQELLRDIETAFGKHTPAVDSVIAFAKTDAPMIEVAAKFEEVISPRRIELEDAIKNFVDYQTTVLHDAELAATNAANITIYTIVVVIAFVVLTAIGVSYVLTRTLNSQIGGAVGQVQSSATELQAAANQQAAGSKEQVTAMNEIATTINELLATARQIAESGQRVAHIARETAEAAGSGAGTVERTQESIVGIRRQVDLIVNHMLDLGKKSQEIGAVLEIVSELAEQTNILAINATIEAAGAGETGKRFAVVADEIRKLADRVTGSTKEIRSLIDDVRGAVNKTVMTTETGSKAVESGSKQFIEVTASFKQIADMVSTTSEAAREIELSTKQQTTAVEQVNIAIANVAQATKETEASSTQTLLTAAQLAEMSRGLQRLIRADAPNGHNGHHEFKSRSL